MNRSDTTNSLAQWFYTAHSKLGEYVQVVRLPKERLAEIIVTII